MQILSKYRLGKFSLFIAILLFVGSGIASDKANSIEIRAALVVGASKEKKGAKKLSESIRKRLAKVFKWRNYYRLSDKQLSIPVDKTKTAKLSKKASIKVSNRKNGRVSVSLFSGGKELIQKSQTLRIDSYMVLAGESTGDSAWFIVISKSN
jgi:hypothetical protein